LVVDEEFWSLEISRGDSNIVVLSGMVELGKTPIDKSQLALLVVNHNVVRLHITVHDSHRVAKVEGFENFENVKTCIVVGECLIQLLEVRIVHVFEDERGSS